MRPFLLLLTDVCLDLQLARAGVVEVQLCLE